LRQTPVIDTKVASVNVTIPLFAGGATYQRAQEATKQLLISKQRKISLLRSIEKETRDAFLSANASVRRIKAVTRAQKTAIKAREAMEKGFSFLYHKTLLVLICYA
jgi:outer membrane protein